MSRACDPARAPQRARSRAPTAAAGRTRARCRGSRRRRARPRRPPAPGFLAETRTGRCPPRDARPSRASERHVHRPARNPGHRRFPARCRPAGAETDPSGGMPQLWEVPLPQSPHRTRWENHVPVLHQQLTVDQPPLMLHTALFQYDLVEGRSILVVIEVELSPAAPGQLQRKHHHTVLRAPQLTQRPGHLVRPGLGVTERRCPVPLHAHQCALSSPKDRTA